MSQSAATLDGAGWSRPLTLLSDPDPRLLQGVFAALVVLDQLLRLAGGGSFRMGPGPGLGLLLLAVVTVTTFGTAWRGVPRAAYVVLPVLDVAVLGLMRLTPGGSGAAILAVLPALWLGRHFGRAGAVTAGVATALLVALPGIAYFGTDGADLSRSVLPPIVALAAAWSVAGGIRQVAAERDEAERRGARLAVALETIEHQRRVSDAILDTVDVGLVLLGPEGSYQSMNRRHADFMRLAFPEGHEGRAGQLGRVYAADATTPLTREEMPSRRASLGEEFDDIRIWVGEDPLTRRALSVSARSVRNEKGEFTGAALAYKDVTELMSVLRVKDDFVASVSHELRTPLTSIMGYVHLLRERDDLAEETASQLEVVARNTERLRRLVADLLHTAQLDDGPMQVVRTRADLAGVVRGCLRAVAPVAEAAGVELESDLPDSLPALLDEQRIAQVVDNLLTNAVKYTPRGGRVVVGLEVDGTRAEIAVADTGMGIAAADRDRLFTRFFRSRDAEERSVQGMGLGLSIAKAIVDSHGGRIEVESDVGRGSVFRVRLPLEAESPGTPPEAGHGS